MVQKAEDGMKKTRFFRYLWRINGVLIFFAALLMVGVLGYIAITFLDFGGHEAEQVVHVEPGAATKVEAPTLQSFYSVSGSTIMRAALTFGSRYSSSSFSKGGSYSTRNYLFFDSETLKAHWLFPDSRQLILECDELREIVQEDESKRPTSRAIAFFYHTIDSDTNGDKQLTRDDKINIAYSRPDGSSYTTVIKGIDRIIGSDTIDRGKRHVLAYEADKKWLTAVISLTTFKIEKTGELPAI